MFYLVSVLYFVCRYYPISARFEDIPDDTFDESVPACVNCSSCNRKKAEKNVGVSLNGATLLNE